MSRFLESIKVESLSPINLEWHQSRVNKTFAQFYSNYKPWELQKLIIPSGLDSNQIYKCRLIYNHESIQVEYVPYKKLKPTTFKLVEIGNFEYAYKFSKREYFQELKKRHSDCDELILLRSGMITDTTYSNLVFQNERGFFTPKDPLLAGTMREKLLAKEIIIPTAISIANLVEYHSFYLINAMLDDGLNSSYDINLIKN